MQRTKPKACDVSLAPPQSAPFSLEAGQFTPATASSPYALFAPLHYERGYAYPLIVWLHGEGSDERQLMRVMPQISMRNYMAVAPRGLRAPLADLPQFGYHWQPLEEHFEAAAERVDSCVEVVRGRYNVAPNRVFLAGFGSGGSMAFRLAFERPDRFAGVLSLCGRFPTRRGMFGNLAAVRRLPIFLTAGRSSSEYASADVCGDLRLLHSAGMSITLRQYPGEQELSPQMLADMDRWIIDQVTSARASG